MITMNASEAKNKFGLMIDRAIKEPVIINKYNRPYVVLISKDLYEFFIGLQEKK